MTMMNARTALIGGISLFLVASQAFAQSGSLGGPAVPPAASPTPGQTPGLTGQAPVGHFQPRRDAVPAELGPYQQSAEDKALDRKLKSICKGC